MPQPATASATMLPGVLAAALAALAALAACAATETGTAPSTPSPVIAVQVCDSALVPVGPDSTLVCPSGAIRALPPAR